jgi:putative membrane protein
MNEQIKKKGMISMLNFINPLTADAASAAQYGDYGCAGAFWNNWGHMMPFGGMFFWIILVLVVLVIVMFAKKTGKGSETLGLKQETALDILKQRYARGELSKEDFERMKQDINE